MTIKKSRKQLELLKVNIAITPKNDLLKKIEQKLISKVPSNGVQLFITTPNPEILVKAARYPKYRKVLNNSDYAIPDGVGISFAARFLYGQSVKRIRGRELFIDLLRISNEKNLKIFLLGASEKVNKSAINKVNAEYPNINVEGSSDIEVYIDQQFEIDKYNKNYNDILNHIKVYKPDILFVFLGAPKQELWVSENKDKLNATVVATIGGALDYYVGKQILPPKVFSTLGLEWLWRLITQPKRIGRIFNALIVFPFLVLKEKVLDNKLQ